MPRVNIPGVGNVNFPDSMSPDEISAAAKKLYDEANKPKKVDHAARLASMKAGEDIPPGVDLETPEDPGFYSRTARNFGEGFQKLQSADDPGIGVADRLLRVITALEQHFTSPLRAATEQFERSWSEKQGMAGPEVEEHARGHADVTAMIAENLFGMGRYAPKTKVPPLKIKPSKEITAEEMTLVEDPETGAVLQPNEPAPPAQAARYEEKIAAKGVDPSDPVAVDAVISQEKGIPPATEITVGKSPISKTTVDGDTVTMDLADGSAPEVLHEKLHHEAEVKGTPHPPEDNAAIMEAELGSAPQRSIDEEVASVPEKPVMRWQGGDPLRGDELDVDFSAASGPYSRRPANAPAGAIDPGIRTTPGGIRTTPSLDKSIVGPKEEAAVANAPLPESLDNVSGGEDVARVERNRASKLAHQARIRAEAKNLTSSASRPDPVKEMDKAEAKNLQKKIEGVGSQIVDLGNIAMTARVGTAARNLRNQGVTAFVSNLDTAIARTIQKKLGVPEKELMPSTTGIWKHLFMSSKEDAATWNMVEGLNDEAVKLFERYMTAERETQFTIPGAEKVAKIGSYLNNLQERWIRTASATNHLDEIARAKAGVDVRTLIERGDFNKVISTDDIAKSIFEAREVSLSLEPTRKLPTKILGLREHAAVRLFAPFLRFRYNNIRFLYHHSPFIAPELGFRFLTNPEWRAALKAGDPKAAKDIAQAITGTMAFATGFGGAKWMLDQDSISAFAQKVNIKPENPLSAYLIAGWLARRAIFNDPVPLYKNDYAWLAEAVAAYSSRTPATDQINSIMNDLTTALGDPSVARQKVMEAAGKWIARYSLLGQTAIKVLSIVDPELAELRDTSGGLFDPSLANIPFINKTLPKRYGTDYAGPTVIQNPAVGELTGISFEKIGSRVNQEMELLQVRPRYNVFQGQPSFNNDYRKEMMMILDEKANAKVNSPEYKNAPVALRRIMLEELVSSASSIAKAKIMKDMPEELRQKFIMSRKDRALMGQ